MIINDTSKLIQVYNNIIRSMNNVHYKKVNSGVTNKYYSVLSILALIVISVSSCQKVIKINLNSSAPQYVIEGNVTDTIGYFSVKIDRSVNFDQDNIFPSVLGATVTITDKNANHTDTLLETVPGLYKTTKLTQGIPGHTYQLNINVAGKILTASSTMPKHVNLDSLYTEMLGFRGKNISVVPVYTDPNERGNFYRFVLVKNDSLSNAVYVRNDQMINGKIMNQPLGGGSGGIGRMQSGDFVSIELQCIDSMIYQFYYTLIQSRNENSATPTNPTCNIVGGQALGYFSAHTSSTKIIILPF